MSDRAIGRARRQAAGLCAAALLGGGAAGVTAARPYRAATLRVAVYADDAPFASEGERGSDVGGVDVDVARAVGRRLGAAVEVRAVPADEEMGDDLRRVLWRGRQVDLFMHVPAAADFAADNPQVAVVGPYFRETQVVARDTAGSRRMVTPFDYGDRPIGVETGSLPDHLLMAALRADGTLGRIFAAHHVTYVPPGAPAPARAAAGTDAR